MLCEQIPAGRVGLALPLFALLLLAGDSAAQSFNFFTIDVPCSACPGGIALSTSASGINPAGDIVGSYTDAAGKSHGFLLSGGQFTNIDVPGELMGVGGTLPTGANAISPSGEIIGTYTAPVSSAPFGSPEYCVAAKPASCIKGFLYSHGQFSTVLFPLPSGGVHPGSVPHHITPNGNIYGCLHDRDTGMSMFGAVWTRHGGFNLTAGGGELGNSDPNAATGVPMSMNNGATPDGHTIVGHWTEMNPDMTTHTHGYFVQNGEFSAYDVPGSAATVIWNINPAGAIVGFYHSDRNHPFLRLSDGSAPITLDLVPGFPAIIGGAAVSINPAGVIVGGYTDPNRHSHGFMAVPMASY